MVILLFLQALWSIYLSFLSRFVKPNCVLLLLKNLSSVAVLAEISLSSPRKLFIFTIKKYFYWIKVSKKKRILKKTSLDLRCILLSAFLDPCARHAEYDTSCVGIANLQQIGRPL